MNTLSNPTPYLTSLILLHAGKALAFSLRANSSLATIALRLWKQRLARRREKQLIATQYHQLQLQSKMLFQWRVQLRVMLKMTKDARALEKFFVIRNAWKTMKVRLEERRRERKLQELETEKTKKAFTRKSFNITPRIPSILNMTNKCRVATEGTTASSSPPG